MSDYVKKEFKNFQDAFHQKLISILKCKTTSKLENAFFPL